MHIATHCIVMKENYKGKDEIFIHKVLQGLLYAVNDMHNVNINNSQGMAECREITVVKRLISLHEHICLVFV